MSYLTIPWTFARTKKAQSQRDTRQSYIEARDSKARNLLGISEEEFETASTRSTSVSSRGRLQSVSFSETSTINVRDSIADKELEFARVDTNLSTSTTNIRPTSFAESQNNLPTITDISDAPKLKRYASSSTLRSYYDSRRAPLSVSQQTSNSSSRDFALRKGTASILSSVGQEMEHARHFLSFKGNKSGSRTGKQPVTQVNSNHVTVPPVSLASGKEPPPDDTDNFQTGRRSTMAITAKPSAERLPAGASMLDGTPCAKINIRRPKAGARHWFDGHEGDSSDEESNNEPEFQQAFVDQVQQGVHDYQAEEISPGQDTARKTSLTPKRKAPYTLMPSLISRMPGSPDDRVARSYSSRKFSTQQKPLKLDRLRQIETPKAKPKCNTLALADLKEQSVLSLSSSDDEDEDERRRQSSDHPRLAKPLPTIRDSIVTDILDDSEVEVGFAQTIHNLSAESMVRVSPVLADITPNAHRLAKDSGINSQVYRSLDSTPPDQNMSEKDMITSFPATPTDSSFRRASLHASTAFSDSASMASTRLMKVTKQEERLLAAMRMKRAAMRDADRAAGRRSALQVLESSGSSSPMLTEDAQSFTEDQTHLDTRLSNRYMPPLSHSRQRSFSGNAAATHQRGSGTTFQTSTGSPSVRDSQATLRSNLSEMSQRPYSTCSRADTQSLRAARNSQTRRNSVRDTFLSLASESSGHVVMLDGLDENLERRTIPSHLFMEAPFIGWEHVGITAAH